MRGNARERKGTGEKGEGGIARVEENGEKEFSASRKNAHCVHARGQLPPSFPLATPCPIPIFPDVSRGEREAEKKEDEREEREREKKERERGEREGGKEGGRIKFRIFADVSL